MTVLSFQSQHGPLWPRGARTGKLLVQRLALQRQGRLGSTTSQFELAEAGRLQTVSVEHAAASCFVGELAVAVWRGTVTQWDAGLFKKGDLQSWNGFVVVPSRRVLLGLDC